MSTFTEFAVERATTEKLEALLNAIAEKGRGVQQVQFLGGRDWVIVSAREVPAALPYGQNWNTGYITVNSAGVMSTPAEELRGEIPPTSAAVAGQHLDLLNLKVGVYESSARTIGPDGTAKPLRHEYSGWVEDHDGSWIIFFDGLGRPVVYWPNRDSDGGVVGDPIKLTDDSKAESTNN